ncbi:hypothetical protein PVAP13_5NG352000 [Panicum virgatum]|uniref:Uncharacterized protein n=1 Tax=Panicum virgatum TaxID=38727 RepID=A0A8T0RT08_PANVG|nr:hypothetical protein PVAP13_5NG352000 [Panicum virgatum]
MVLIHPFEFGTCNHPTFESGCWPAPARNSHRPSCDPFVRPSSYPNIRRNIPPHEPPIAPVNHARAPPPSSARRPAPPPPVALRRRLLLQRSEPGTDDEYGCELGLDFNFDFSSRCLSPAATAMPPTSSSTTARSGQCGRPFSVPAGAAAVTRRRPRRPSGAAAAEAELKAAPTDERGHFRSRSVHHRSRSLSPFRTLWLSPSSSPAPAASSGEPVASTHLYLIICRLRRRRPRRTPPRRRREAAGG